MSERLHTIEAADVAATIDLSAGHVRRFAVRIEGRSIEPLHKAPWVDDPVIAGDETIPRCLRCLAGDFFCAPFGVSDLEDGPAHGATANSQWRWLETVRKADAVTARFELVASVLGARVFKEFTLRDGHPFLYQRHVFAGGEGAVPVANHAMIRLPAGGRISFSAKAFGLTPGLPQESDPARGRSRLLYPSRFQDLRRVPLADRGTADITRYPIAEKHEDFLGLVERPGNRLGWCAVVRPDRNELFVSLKDPRDFPFTFLWFSNGGRDYSPWNGRHLAVLGIEEGRACLGDGHRASIAANILNEEGFATALALDPNGCVEVRNVIGGLVIPADEGEIMMVSTDRDRLFLRGRSDAPLAVPFDGGFLGRDQESMQ